MRNIVEKCNDKYSWEMLKSFNRECLVGCKTHLAPLLLHLLCCLSEHWSLLDLDKYSIWCREVFIIAQSIGNSIVYRNSKLWKIIIWLLCIINCFCLWYSIIWWYCIIFVWKKLWLSIIWFYDDFPSYDDYAS